jgi:hypothetical protein
LGVEMVWMARELYVVWVRRFDILNFFDWRCDSKADGNGFFFWLVTGFGRAW